MIFPQILTAYLTSVFATKTMDYSLTRMSLVEEFVSNIYLSKVTLWDSCFTAKIDGEFPQRIFFVLTSYIKYQMHRCTSVSDVFFFISFRNEKTRID